MTLLCGQSSNLRGKSNRFYKFCFITNDIQDVSAGTIGGKTDLLAPGACLFVDRDSLSFISSV